MTAPAVSAGAPARGASGRPGGRVPRTASARIAAALIALVAAVALAFTLTHSAPSTRPRPAATPANPDALIGGATLQNARCSNWLVASAADKARALSALEYSVGGPTEYEGVRGTTLSRAEGYQLLDNACASQITRHFLLYELYIRAAAFRSLLPPQP